jgi:hypothetical protein
VAEDVALAHARQISVDEVQIRSAGRGQSNLNDHVVRVDQAGIIDRLDGQIVNAVPTQCAHDAQ